jgi:starch synthase (maltosyl-transferring)
MTEGAPPVRRGACGRVVLENLEPAVDGGRFPIKRTVGEEVEVVVTAFVDGHDLLAVVVRDRPLGPDRGREARESAGNEADGWRETGMTSAGPGTDRWRARFRVDAVGWHEYHVIGWIDRFGTWRRDLELKFAAGQDVSLELLEGALMIREAAARADSRTADALLEEADRLAEPLPLADRVARALAGDLNSRVAVVADRQHVSASGIYRVWVDRERARFGAWYEMFPRSGAPDPGRSATFHEAAQRLPSIADLGFDVVYLPPIHPIGVTHRKGRNNALVPSPGDPGCPWAIGSADGGHTAVEPGLGTVDDFRAFRDEAARLGLEVALDLAWQCSPDHPWLREHPEWFRHRPDGTIKYAENPPKRYQDIYPFDFESEDWQSLWAALRDVALFWIRQGVLIFRVDNPHTKPFAFWEWFIAEIHERHPSVIFLSEAFTRPAPMRRLAKLGFTQSYTYFTWRNTRHEIGEYFTELTATPMREYFRPNLFANTPDILHAYLQGGGRPAFEARLLLAATLGANYGIYNGFELCEARAVPGTEEYVDSEKYQYRQWDWNRPGHIKELIARVNAIRRGCPAFQSDWSLRFHDTDNPEIIAYSKSAAGQTLLTVVSLDPHHMQHGHVRVPTWMIGRDESDDFMYVAYDLLDDVKYEWRGQWNYVRFDPGVRQGHILRLEARS